MEERRMRGGDVVPYSKSSFLAPFFFFFPFVSLEAPAPSISAARASMSTPSSLALQRGRRQCPSINYRSVTFIYSARCAGPRAQGHNNTGPRKAAEFALSFISLQPSGTGSSNLTEKHLKYSLLSPEQQSKKHLININECRIKNFLNKYFCIVSIYQCLENPWRQRQFIDRRVFLDK